MTDSYSQTYAEAREKFLSIASNRQAKIISVPHPSERGAQGEELAMDFAIFGDPDAEKTLFLVSGTHGQEGFYGSALQVAFLGDLDIPDGVNVVALHGLNPWGFSHLSRTDHQNIDVNRNFTDYVPLEQDEIYPPLFRALCPEDWTEETIDWSPIRKELEAAYGMERLVTAAGGGQIVEPTGMNYVGTAPSWSRTVVEELLPKIFAKSKKIAFIEWHTGLGDYAELSHIPMMKPGSPGYERMFDWLGDDARTTWERGMDGDFKGAKPNYRGWFSAWLPSTVPQAEWAGMVIEAGTYGVVEVMDGVRIDRWLKFANGRSIMTREAMRETMMDKLYPVAPDWRATALKNGLGAQQAFLDGLQRW
jgi:hypothetical protein